MEGKKCNVDVFCKSKVFVGGQEVKAPGYVENERCGR